MVKRWSENDITNKKQTKKIQKDDASRVSAGRNHIHVVMITWWLIFYLVTRLLPSPSH